MANDRIYLVCPYCEEFQLLYKFYPNNGGYMWEPETMGDFLNKHLTKCHGASWSLGGSPGVVMLTDSMTPHCSGDFTKQIMEAMGKCHTPKSNDEQCGLR